MVLTVIQDARNSGVWTKTVQSKTNIPQGKLDKIFKALEGRSLVKQMKVVAHPSRKMYIVSGLTPSEEATGGSWFSEGTLDQGMITAVSGAIEMYVAKQSWREVDLDDLEDSATGYKRKRPSEGFDEPGNDRVKMTKMADGQQKLKHSKHQGRATSYVLFEPGHQMYPTVYDITQNLTTAKVTAAPLPENAIAQLLQVMVYDGRLFKLTRAARSNELADEFDANTVTMYRCFKTPAVVQEERVRYKHKMSPDPKVRMAAYRAEELAALGPGGSSEVPCMRCPVFDICGDGGPVNAAKCVYFNEWYDRIDEADMEKEAKDKKVRERDKSSLEKGKGKEKDLQRQSSATEPGIAVELEEDEPL
jgi:DNA-directed RNA polymerase III subunit RPC6